MSQLHRDLALLYKKYWLAPFMPSVLNEMEEGINSFCSNVRIVRQICLTIKLGPGRALGHGFIHLPLHGRQALYRPE